MKSLTLIYCGQDGDAGKALSKQIRSQDEGMTTQLCSSEYFEPSLPPPQRVVIMPDVPGFVAEKIRAAYPKNVFEEPGVMTPPSEPIQFFQGAFTPGRTTVIREGNMGRVAKLTDFPIEPINQGAVLTPPMQVAQMQANNNALAEVIPIKRPRGRPRKVAV